MSNAISDVIKRLDSDSKEIRIKALNELSATNDPRLIQKIISKLNDPDIEVRGEAFSTLVLNENRIADFLIQNLNSESKYVRGFSALVLANRHDDVAVSEIMKLTKDPSAMVRECALGSLGFLKADTAGRAIRECFTDCNLEVKKSAVKAAIDIGEKILPEEISKISKEKDEELEKLLVIAKQ